MNKRQIKKWLKKHFPLAKIRNEQKKFVVSYLHIPIGETKATKEQYDTIMDYLIR